MIVNTVYKVKLNSYDHKALGNGQSLTFVNGSDEYEIILISD